MIVAEAMLIDWAPYLNLPMLRTFLCDSHDSRGSLGRVVIGRGK